MNNKQAVDIFTELVKKLRYDEGDDPEPRPLSNFTFWAGAGFTRAWREEAPLSKDLFALDKEYLSRFDHLGALSRLFGESDDTGFSPDTLRQIVYQLDMYQQYTEIRTRYLDDLNIRMFKSAIVLAVQKRYMEICDLDIFDDKIGKFNHNSELSEEQIAIVKYFKFLIEECFDISQLYAEGIRTHFITTNYDFAIESILDHVFSPDDSLYLYTYRGFTPIEISGFDSPIKIHNHELVLNLFKINGGFEIYRHGHEYRLDYQNDVSMRNVREAPIVMLPSREQSYSDEYFRHIFPKAVTLLRETKVLFVVGYSFPEDDALIRFILRQFSEESEDGRGKFLFIIDPLARTYVQEALRSVFQNLRPGNVVTYKGSFSGFASDCVKHLRDKRIGFHEVW